MKISVLQRQKNKMNNIDHIVYTVQNLEQAIHDIEKQFGVMPVYGGKHQNQGTHNALLNLGNNCYLELLAPDPENKDIVPPRWMGVDLITQPKITRWAIKSNAIQKDINILKAINPRLAKTKTGSRQKQDGSILKWKLSLPQPSPEVEIIPFLIDWKDSQHPTIALPQHCELINLQATHPNPQKMLTQLKRLHSVIQVKQKNKIALIATIKTPSGLITL